MTTIDELAYAHGYNIFQVRKYYQMREMGYTFREAQLLAFGQVIKVKE